MVDGVQEEIVSEASLLRGVAGGKLFRRSGTYLWRGRTVKTLLECERQVSWPSSQISARNSITCRAANRAVFHTPCGLTGLWLTKCTQSTVARENASVKAIEFSSEKTGREKERAGGREEGREGGENGDRMSSRSLERFLGSLALNGTLPVFVFTNYLLAGSFVVPKRKRGAHFLILNNSRPVRSPLRYVYFEFFLSHINTCVCVLQKIECILVGSFFFSHWRYCRFVFLWERKERKRVEKTNRFYSRPKRKAQPNIFFAEGKSLCGNLAQTTVWPRTVFTTLRGERLSR